MIIDRTKAPQNNGGDPDDAAGDYHVPCGGLVPSDDAQIAEDGNGKEEAAGREAAEADHEALQCALGRRRIYHIHAKPGYVGHICYGHGDVRQEKVVDEQEQWVWRPLATS